MKNSTFVSALSSFRVQGLTRNEVECCNPLALEGAPMQACDIVNEAAQERDVNPQSYSAYLRNLERQGVLSCERVDITGKGKSWAAVYNLTPQGLDLYLASI